MARSMTDRIKEWRNRKINRGGKSLTVMLEPDTAILLEEMKNVYHESNAKVVARAIKRLADSFTCKPSDSVTDKSPAPSGLPGKPGDSPGVGVHPSLKRIRKELDRGATVVALKEKIKQAMREMRSQGCGSSEIVDLLFQAQIKTVGGKEKWEGGTVRKWWK